MVARYVKTEFLDAPSIAIIGADAAGFVRAWRSSSLATTGIEPDGIGSVSDINALDYIIYESAYDLVTPDESSFIALSASIFGGCLKHLLGFDWCRVHLPSSSVLGVKHPYNELVIPLEATVASHLSGEPQYGNFAALFFNVLQSTHVWPLGSHFLEESTWSLSPGEYKLHWGFSVPESLSRKYLHLSAVDEAYAMREVGLLAYDWNGVPAWSEIEGRLAEIESDYVSIYGSDWRERLKIQSPQLFA